MISELEQLEEVIQSKDQTIKHLSDYLDKLIINRDKMRGLLADYDAGRTTASMLVSYLRMYLN